MTTCRRYVGSEVAQSLKPRHAPPSFQCDATVTWPPAGMTGGPSAQHVFCYAHACRPPLHHHPRDSSRRRARSTSATRCTSQGSSFRSRITHSTLSRCRPLVCPITPSMPHVHCAKPQPKIPSCGSAANCASAYLGPYSL